MSFLILYRDYLKDLSVTSFPDKDAAKAHLNTLTNEWAGFIIDSVDDLKASFKVPAQVGLFNSLRQADQAEVKDTHFANATDRLTKLYDRIAGTRVDMIVGRKPREVKPAEPKAPRELKKGVIYHVKAFVTLNPHATDDEIAAYVKEQGVESPSMNTISTFRADHLHTLRVMADLGKYDMPPAPTTETPASDTAA